MPYRQVLRTAANEATSLVTPIDLNIGGTNIPAGKYTLFSLPSEGALCVGYSQVIKSPSRQGVY